MAATMPLAMRSQGCFNVRVRWSPRLLAYAAGWAALTVLAAGAVWWGLGPLLAPVLLPIAAPSPPSSPASSAAAVPSLVPSATVSPTAAPAQPRTSAPATPRPQPSSYDGWDFVDGVFTRSFDTTGGQAVVRIAGGRVELVSATPSPGYQVRPQQPEPQRLVIEFFDGTHFIVLDAMWWENRPYAKVTNVGS
jgi:hypothetical protein